MWSAGISLCSSWFSMITPIINESNLSKDNYSWTVSKYSVGIKTNSQQISRAFTEILSLDLSLIEQLETNFQIDTNIWRIKLKNVIFCVAFDL